MFKYDTWLGLIVLRNLEMLDYIELSISLHFSGLEKKYKDKIGIYWFSFTYLHFAYGFQKRIRISPLPR